MKLLIKKKSGKPFPPPFNGLGLTAIAVGIIPHPKCPRKNTMAYLLENGTYVETNKCIILENYDTV